MRARQRTACTSSRHGFCTRIGTQGRKPCDTLRRPSRTRAPRAPPCPATPRTPPDPCQPDPHKNRSVLREAQPHQRNVPNGGVGALPAFPARVMRNGSGRDSTDDTLAAASGDCESMLTGATRHMSGPYITNSCSKVSTTLVLVMTRASFCSIVMAIISPYGLPQDPSGQHFASAAWMESCNFSMPSMHPTSLEQSCKMDMHVSTTHFSAWVALAATPRSHSASMHANWHFMNCLVVACSGCTSFSMHSVVLEQLVGRVFANPA
mmetsp:Transcript_12600/g.27937  ORF Transcript_12600/g.27937 Transcript_12600/m.27937 type:complete len:264 (-) Transcript_12600:947-1738(-)